MYVWRHVYLLVSYMVVVKIFEPRVSWAFSCLLENPISLQVMTARIMQRSLSSGRIDDNEEAIRKRLVTYRESTMPIIEEFAFRGELREVNSDQSVGKTQTQSSLSLSFVSALPS